MTAMNYNAFAARETARSERWSQRRPKRLPPPTLAYGASALRKARRGITMPHSWSFFTSPLRNPGWNLRRFFPRRMRCRPKLFDGSVGGFILQGMQPTAKALFQIAEIPPCLVDDPPKRILARRLCGTGQPCQRTHGGRLARFAKGAPVGGCGQ